MKNVVLIGEIRLSDKAAVHQADFAKALDAERLTGWPKAGEFRVIVGKLLGKRKPALLIRAEKNDVPVVTVADALTDDVRARLKDVLASKPKLETYEKAAFELLAGPVDPAPLPKQKRGGKKFKVPANG